MILATNDKFHCIHQKRPKKNDTVGQIHHSSLY